MADNIHDMQALFEQLGLDGSKEGIAQFINTHKLAGNESLEAASFWTPAQADFIRSSWEDDSDWVGIIDSLNAALH